MFALNQGEVCTCPSRALVQESIYDKFMERAVARIKQIVEGNPLDPKTMIGAQASNDQLEKILSYIEIGKKEGAKVLTGGARRVHAGELEDGYYVQPTIFEGHNRMRIFQEEIFGPVVSVTKFKDPWTTPSRSPTTRSTAWAPGVWSRDANTCYRMGRAIKAGRVWTNCYHAYPAHAAFGGYKQSGIGRENHRMMLDHYQQTKNLLVSYSPKKLGFFYMEVLARRDDRRRPRPCCASWWRSTARCCSTSRAGAATAARRCASPRGEFRDRRAGRAAGRARRDAVLHRRPSSSSSGSTPSS